MNVFTAAIRIPGLVVRLGGFALVLVVALAIGVLAGATIGPDPTPVDADAPPPVGQGVLASRDGYRLQPASSQLDHDGGPFRFVIDDPDGRPVTRFTAVHERDLHLIVVNRELTEYHHVHPTMDTDGTWSIELDAMPAGSYRAITDFQVTGGPRLALGVDLSVSGTYVPSVLPEPSAHATVDGYDVEIAVERGSGGEVTATLTVSRDGRPVADLQPYLGANGHLVAIRSGDLAYAHVHPIDEHDAGPPADGSVTFDAELDAAGRYGLFFDFQHRGVVHTATFTFDQGVVTGATGMEH